MAFPEYFTDFEHKGLTYVDTVLIDVEQLNKAKAGKFGSLKYRPKKNSKWNS